MAKKNIKLRRGKLETWLPIFAMGGTIIGAILTFFYENIMFMLAGSCIGLVLGTILGVEDIELESKKTKSKKQTKSKTKKK